MRAPIRLRVEGRARALAGALALVFATCSKAAPPKPSGPPPNVVVIVLDTARPDCLSAYGYSKPTSPFLEEFARAGTRFDRAYSVSGWTLPAHASLFSGLMPDVHGANQKNKKVCDAAPMLAERLARAGYQTAGFSNNPWVSVKTGLARGFQTFLEKLNRRGKREDRLFGGKLAHPTVAAVNKWFESDRVKTKPFFLFVNLIEPHLPYKPPFEAAQPFFATEKELNEAIYSLFPDGKASSLQNRHYARKEPLSDAEWETLRRLYDGDLRFTDVITRAILATVDRESDSANTLVFIVSDHGENLGEHGHISHIFNLYESNLRIVCLARGPGFEAGAVRNDLVQIHDLYPTILRAAHLEPEKSCAGVDMLGERPKSRTLRAMLDYPHVSLDTFPAELRESGVLDAYKRDLLGAVTADFKAIQGSDGSLEAFDLSIDPLELSALAGPLPPSRGAVKEALARALGPMLCTITEGPEFDAETHKELQALGYAGDDDAEKPKSGDE